MPKSSAHKKQQPHIFVTCWLYLDYTKWINYSGRQYPSNQGCTEWGKISRIIRICINDNLCNSLNFQMLCKVEPKPPSLGEFPPSKRRWKARSIVGSDLESGICLTSRSIRLLICHHSTTLENTIWRHNLSRYVKRCRQREYLSYQWRLFQISGLRGKRQRKV